MSISIKTVDDINVFIQYVLNNPFQALCYVYYKNNMIYPNVRYVGFTNQKGIKKYLYLNKHHKMNSLIYSLNEGYSINFYIKYSERSLITLFKPTLNIYPGCGMIECRNIDKIENIIHQCGDIINIKCKNEKEKVNSLKISYIDEIWENVYKSKNAYNSINVKLVIYLIEKYKTEIINDNSSIINDPIFSSIIDDLSVDILVKSELLTYARILSVLTICKLDKIYVSFMLIHKILKKYILWHLNNLNINENKCCSCGKVYKNNFNLMKHINKSNHIIKEDWVKTINSSNNKFIICAEILETLRENNYLISNSFLSNKK